MKLVRGLLVVSLVLVMTSSAFAGWFGFSEEEYVACKLKYFGNPEVTVENVLAIDLANIENKNDAKMLYKTMDPFIEEVELEYKALGEKCEVLIPEVDRLFETLYTKEVHDELWEGTFSLRKAAYNKVLTEYLGTAQARRGTGTKLAVLEYKAAALKKISKRFVEIKADASE